MAEKTEYLDLSVEEPSGLASSMEAGEPRVVINIKRPSAPPKSTVGKELDICFVLDVTGSMGTYLQEARDRLSDIAQELCAQQSFDLRMALIVYRDHQEADKRLSERLPEKFVTRTTPFTAEVHKLVKKLHEYI